MIFSTSPEPRGRCVGSDGMYGVGVVLFVTSLLHRTKKSPLTTVKQRVVLHLSLNFLVQTSVDLKDPVRVVLYKTRQ